MTATAASNTDRERIARKRQVPPVNAHYATNHPRQSLLKHSEVQSRVRQTELMPGPHLDPDWRAYKSKGAPDLVFQKALVGEVQLYLAVRKQDERGRSDRGLRHIEDFHPLAHGHRGAIEINPLEKSVHLRGRDPLAPLGRHLL